MMDDGDDDDPPFEIFFNRRVDYLHLHRQPRKSNQLEEDYHSSGDTANPIEHNHHVFNHVLNFNTRVVEKP